MEITSDTTRIRLAAFQLEGEAQVWWKWARTSRDLEAMTWARVLFDSGASHSFIVASVVIELGLEVETLEEPLYVSSPLGIRARIWMICSGCELEISGTLLTVDLRIMDMSEFDVILGMDWLIAYRVVIDCERRKVTAYTQDDTHVDFRGTSMIFCPRQCTSPGVRDS